MRQIADANRLYKTTSVNPKGCEWSRAFFDLGAVEGIYLTVEVGAQRTVPLPIICEFI